MRFNSTGSGTLGNVTIPVSSVMIAGFAGVTTRTSVAITTDSATITGSATRGSSIATPEFTGAG